MKDIFFSREPAYDAAAFVGLADLLAWMGEKVNSSAPQNCSIVGEPRAGKTSLLYQAYAQRLGGQHALHVWARLVTLPRRDGQNLWPFLLRMLQKAIDPQADSAASADRQASSAEDAYDSLDRTLSRLLVDETHDRVLFFIDDFDLLVPGIEARDLDWLRALATAHTSNLAFVVTSSSDLHTALAPVSSERPISPFTNLFTNHYLELLQDDEALDLIRRADAIVPEVRLDAADQAFLLREAGRHPALLKIACERLLAVKREEGSGLSDQEQRQLASLDFRQDDAVLSLFRQLTDRRTIDERAALLALAREEATADPSAIRRLEKRYGLVERRQGTPALFADAYRDWLLPQDAPALQAVMASAGAAAEGFVFNPGQRRVHIEGKEIFLTPQEDRLLSYLVAEPGRVCSNQELLEHVWGVGKSRAAVEKAINRLREKIEPDPERPRYIISVWGQGYALSNHIKA